MGNNKQKINSKKGVFKMDENKQGIFFKGVVTGRTRRTVGEKMKTLITYKMSADGKEFFIKDWEAGEEFFAVGEVVTIPLYVKPYMTSGQIRLDYVINKSNNIFGEEF